MSLDTSRIKALCFDVDGTLADTDDLFVEILANFLRPIELFPSGLQKWLTRGAQPHEKNMSVAIARRMVMKIESPANILFGLPDRLHLDRPIHTISNWLKQQINRTSHDSQTTTLTIIPGVKEMLAALYQNYPLSVVSARGERDTMRFLNHFNLTKYFRCIVTAQTCQHTKPFPDPVLWAAEQMGVSPSDCLMIGDTTVDIRAGRTAGAQTLGVLCGFGTREELLACGANEIVGRTPDIMDHLR